MSEESTQETGDWYCKNCGYLDGSRVTYSETCDSCHTPVEWHSVSDQTLIEKLQSELTACKEALAEREWVSVTPETLPDANLGPVLGFHKQWIDEDFNPKGIRECFVYGDGSEWQSAKWDGYADQWITSDEAPSHWQPLPSLEADNV